MLFRRYSGWTKIVFVLILIFIIIFTIYTGTLDKILRPNTYKELNDNKNVINRDKEIHNNISVTETITKIDDENDKVKGQLYCYRSKDETLKDISSVKPRPDKSIFFHETSCKSSEKGKIWLGTRQACAVESAARLHPNMDVYLLFSSPGVFKFEGDESDKVLQALLSYNNVQMLHLDYGNYINGTPVENLYKNGLIEKNDEFAVAHASDILRYLTLWKYGGVYLDTDVVVMKSFDDLAPNFAGMQSDSEIAAGVFKFSSTGFGHKMVERCLKHLKERFDPYGWSESSVGVISSVATDICNVTKPKDLLSTECGDFQLYPMEDFYAIHYSVWDAFFNEKDTDLVLTETKESYAIHLWNKLSWNNKVSKKVKNAYNYYAKKYCPKVFANIEDQF